MAERILSLIIIGILSGGVYGLLAMGLSLQYGVCRVLNIAHGEFVMLGAMLTVFLSFTFGINPLVTPVIIGPLLFGLGFLLQITLFRGLKARAPLPAAFEGNALLAAFGLMYIINNLAQMRWGSGLHGISIFNQSSAVYRRDEPFPQPNRSLRSCCGLGHSCLSLFDPLPAGKSDQGHG